MIKRIDVPIGVTWSPRSRRRIELARGFAALGVLWAVNLCLRRLTLEIRIGSRVHRHQISVRAKREELDPFNPLPTWSARERCLECGGSGGRYEQTHATLAGEHWVDCDECDGKGSVG